MNNVPVLVVTSHKHIGLMQAFSYLFNHYWSSIQPVIVVTDTLPTFNLPPNFRPISMTGGKVSRPEEWSSILIRALTEHVTHQQFMLLLEDYWLVRTVDVRGIDTLSEYARIHNSILRMDLTDDRQYNGHARDIGAWGHYDLVETGPEAEYQMSLQAAIWNRHHMLSILRPGLTPWQVELYLSPALSERPELRIVGSKQAPIRYANVMKSEKGFVESELDKVPREHVDEMERRGYLLRKVNEVA